jgi:hypothetical protein
MKDKYSKPQLKVRLAAIAGIGWSEDIGGLRSNRMSDDKVEPVRQNLSAHHVKASWHKQLSGGWRAFVTTGDARKAFPKL